MARRVSGVSPRREPASEFRIAIDLHPFQQIAANRFAHLGEKFGCGLLDPALHDPIDLDRIHDAIGQVERDAISVGDDATAIAVVEHAAKLAEAPAELASRIVGTSHKRSQSRERDSECESSAMNASKARTLRERGSGPCTHFG